MESLRGKLRAKAINSAELSVAGEVGRAFAQTPVESSDITWCQRRSSYFWRHELPDDGKKTSYAPVFPPFAPGVASDREWRFMTETRTDSDGFGCTSIADWTIWPRYLVHEGREGGGFERCFSGYT